MDDHSLENQSSLMRRLLSIAIRQASGHEGSIVFRATLTFGRRRSPAKRPFDLEAAMVGKG
jgi:hypothetical protein